MNPEDSTTSKGLSSDGRNITFANSSQIGRSTQFTSTVDSTSNTKLAGRDDASARDVVVVPPMPSVDPLKHRMRRHSSDHRDDVELQDIPPEARPIEV